MEIGQKILFMTTRSERKIVLRSVSLSLRSHSCFYYRNALEIENFSRASLTNLCRRVTFAARDEWKLTVGVDAAR